MPGSTAAIAVLVITLAALHPASARADGPRDAPQGPVPGGATPPGPDPLIPRPVESDYRLINLPTAAPMPRLRSNFQITHRFAGNLRRGDFGFQASNLFGLDQGATVGFEYRFAVARRLQAAIYRVTLDKTFQFHGLFNAVRQGGSMPVSVSAVFSVEGPDNFQERRAPAVGAVVSRAVGNVASVYATPVWVHNTAALLGVDRNTGILGLGTRVRVRPSLFVVAEVSPRVGGYAPNQPEFGFAFEKRLGGHVFQVNVTNTPGTTFAEAARGGSPASLYLGFNLSRKF